MSLAGLFPGQGAQAVGMLSEFAAAHPEIGETLAEAPRRRAWTWRG